MRGKNQKECGNFWLINCLQSPNLCLCMLAFKVFTLSHFHLCIHWHFFILVSLVMEDGSYRTQHRRSSSKLGPRPLRSDRPLCVVLPLTCAAHLPILSLCHHYLLYFPSWLSVRFAMETCLRFPFRSEIELQVCQDIEDMRPGCLI